MAKRPYAKRLTRIRPTYAVSTRIEEPIYEKMLEEADVDGCSISALLKGHLTVLYDEEEFNARLRESIEREEREAKSEREEWDAPLKHVEEPAAEKPAKSIFADPSQFDDEPFPLVSDEEPDEE